MFKLIKHGELDWLFFRDSFFYTTRHLKPCRPFDSMIGKKHQLQWEVLGRDVAIEKMREYFPATRVVTSIRDYMEKWVDAVAASSAKVEPYREKLVPIKLWVDNDEKVIQTIVDRHFGDHDNWVGRFAPRTKHLIWDDLAYPTLSHIAFGNDSYPAVSYGRTPFMVGAAAMGKTEAAFVLHDHQKALLAHTSLLLHRNRKINNHSTFGSFLKPRNQGKSTALNPLEYAREMNGLIASFAAGNSLREKGLMSDVQRVLDIEANLLFGVR